MNVSHVICIDFEPGIPGGAIAAEVAEILRLPLLDREIITRATAKLELPAPMVAALEGEPDHPIERWLLAAAEGDQALGIVGRTTSQSDPIMQPRQPLMRAIRESIEEVSGQPCVIANHHAAYILEGRREAIRILLSAGRTQRQRWLDEQRPSLAENRARRIEELDRAERAYVRQAYRRHWPDWQIYHLVVDMGMLPIERTAHLVADYARSIRRAGDLTQ